MELQDFALQHLYSQLGFAESQPAVVDTRGSTAKAMQKHLGLTNASLQPTAAEVSSDDGRDHYRIGIAQTYASLMNVDDLAQAKEQTDGFLKMAMEHLQKPAVAALNIRTFDIAPADSFEDLRDALRRGLTPAAPGLIDAVGVPLSDLTWVFEFKDQDTAVSVQFGPMENEQLRAILQDPDGADYPDNALFLSVDTKLRHKDGNSQDPLEWWDRSVEAHRKKAGRIGEWLREGIT
jgi:hypothetical protein